MVKPYDMIIIGGGFAGLSLATAVANAVSGDARIAVVDRADSARTGAHEHDDIRASAISASSRGLLTSIGAWSAIEPHAQPVNTIEITDSRLHDAIRPTLLTYDNTLASGATATSIVENHYVIAALRAAAKRTACSITMIAGQPLSVATSASNAIVTLEDGRTLSTALIVAADGKRSMVREAAGIKTVAWTYPQTGIVTIVRHEKSHDGRAIQHFLPSGPFAILPLRPIQAATQYDHRSCITWSEDATEAKRILALDDTAFLAELEQRFGHRLGALALSGPRQSWPLDMHLARALIANRVALVGDAAHGVHPIAGQGLNLAFRDVAALAEVVVDAMRLGLDIGATTVLERYERWRRLDNVMSTATFDALNAIFSSENTGLRTARGAGLGLVDRLPALKNLLVTEAAGMSGDVPKLLRGEKL